VHHRSSEVFRAGLTAFLRESNTVSRPVVLDHVRVIHRDVYRTLFEITHRIAPNPHDFRNQPVSF
jgi:hypothetical protein